MKACLFKIAPPWRFRTLETIVMTYMRVMWSSKFLLQFSNKAIFRTIGSTKLPPNSFLPGPFYTESPRFAFLLSSNCSFRLTDLIPKRVWLSTDRKVPFELSKNRITGFVNGVWQKDSWNLKLHYTVRFRNKHSCTHLDHAFFCRVAEVYTTKQ